MKILGWELEGGGVGILNSLQAGLELAARDQHAARDFERPRYWI